MDPVESSGGNRRKTAFKSMTAAFSGLRKSMKKPKAGVGGDNSGDEAARSMSAGESSREQSPHQGPAKAPSPGLLAGFNAQGSPLGWQSLSTQPHVGVAAPDVPTKPSPQPSALAGTWQFSTLGMNPVSPKEVKPFEEFSEVEPVVGQPAVAETTVNPEALSNESMREMFHVLLREHNALARRVNETIERESTYLRVIEEKEGQLRKLRAKIDNANKSNPDQDKWYSREVHVLQRKLTESEQRRRATEDDLDLAVVELQGQRKECAELENIIDDAMKTVSQQTISLEGYGIQVDELKATIERLEKENMRLVSEKAQPSPRHSKPPLGNRGAGGSIQPKVRRQLLHESHLKRQLAANHTEDHEMTQAQGGGFRGGFPPQHKPQ